MVGVSVEWVLLECVLLFRGHDNASLKEGTPMSASVATREHFPCGIGASLRDGNVLLHRLPTQPPSTTSAHYRIGPLPHRHGEKVFVNRITDIV